TADQLLRNSAEATKSAVRSDCGSAGTYSVAFSALPSPDPTETWQQYYVPLNFTLPTDITNQSCPPTSGPLTAQTPVVTLSVNLPDGIQKSLKIVLRAP